MELRPGVHLGPYRVVRLLGKGGMGAVYEAQDLRLGRPVAIKLLQGLFDDEARRRMAREARAAAAAQGPHVVRLHDVTELGGAMALVLELCPGGSLGDRLRRGPLPWREAADLGAQVAEGLATIHAAGFVHRDLKPDNVLLAADGRALVSDLGLVRAEQATGQSLAGGLTREGAVLGTVGYMAPEQADGRPVDARADLWALGATLHALLVGEAPFTGGSTIEVLAKLLGGEPPPRVRARARDVPPALDALVARLMTHDPVARGRDAATVAAELRALADGPTAGASRAGLAAGVAAALVVGALAGVAFATAGRTPAPAPTPPAVAAAPPATAPPATAPPASPPTEAPAAEPPALAVESVASPPGGEGLRVRLRVDRAARLSLEARVAAPAAPADEDAAAPAAPVDGPVVAARSLDVEAGIHELGLPLGEVADGTALAVTVRARAGGEAQVRVEAVLERGPCLRLLAPRAAAAVGPPGFEAVVEVDRPVEVALFTDQTAAGLAPVATASLGAPGVHRLRVPVAPGRPPTRLEVRAADGRRLRASAQRALRGGAPRLDFTVREEGPALRLSVTPAERLPALVPARAGDAPGAARPALPAGQAWELELGAVAGPEDVLEWSFSPDGAAPAGPRAAPRPGFAVRAGRPPTLPAGVSRVDVGPAGVDAAGLTVLVPVYALRLPGDAGELELVWVPPGPFETGLDPLAWPRLSWPYSTPPRAHRAERGLFVGRTEVTWSQYRAFCRATGRPAPARPEWAGAEHPASEVSLPDARAFCRWAGGRLPTEEEWERAARGRDRRPFPWGEEPPGEHLCAFGGNRALGGRRTAPVGRFPAGASPWGALDLAGNVREWVEAPADPLGAVIRGGATESATMRCTVGYRGHRPRPELGSPFDGLRLVLDP